MLEFNNPIPVVTPEGESAYAIYATNSGMWDNDVWCCALCNGGQIRHYNTSQLRIFANATFDITKNEQQDRQKTTQSS